jgi:CheY-like chemotaxis protein
MLAYTRRVLAKRRILFVSSNAVAASVLEQHLGSDFEVHSAATDDAAFALLEAYTYACVVVDLCARSVAGAETASTIRLNALTPPVIAIVPAGAETVLPENTVACINDEQQMTHLVDAVKRTCR